METGGTVNPDKVLLSTVPGSEAKAWKELTAAEPAVQPGMATANIGLKPPEQMAGPARDPTTFSSGVCACHKDCTTCWYGACCGVFMDCDVAAITDFDNPEVDDVHGKGKVPEFWSQRQGVREVEWREWRNRQVEGSWADMKRMWKRKGWWRMAATCHFCTLPYVGSRRDYCWSYCCACARGASSRRQLREKYGLQYSGCGASCPSCMDCLLHTPCLHPCAVCQEARQLQEVGKWRRGYYHLVLNHSPKSEALDPVISEDRRGCCSAFMQMLCCLCPTALGEAVGMGPLLLCRAAYPCVCIALLAAISPLCPDGAGAGSCGDECMKGCDYEPICCMRCYHAAFK